uniref:CAZy families GH27 protein n=1 Tax=uncultured Paenibacillus sp. TaxID=227322 RepID=A0A060CQH7_9BACL|nr:CAZy families GH27 protein [uncultured Paenibacillus sp.]
MVGSAVVELLGRPMTIETNMQSRPVTLTLPLPKDITQEQLDHLAIYIEHSDGTKEVVRGTVVEFQKE